jgi:hypothetical protein
MLRPFLRRAGESAASARRHKRSSSAFPSHFIGGRCAFFFLGGDAEHRKVVIAMVRKLAVDEDPVPAAHLVKARTDPSDLAGWESSVIYLARRNDTTAARTSTSTSCLRLVRRPAAAITAEPAAPIR